MNDKENRDLLIELRTQNVEILRRLTDYDKIIVPRSEYAVTIQELRSQHLRNQEHIESIENQIRAIVWKVGGALGTLQVVTALALYFVSSS